jgi:hypothetical protein
MREKHELLSAAIIFLVSHHIALHQFVVVASPAAFILT